MDPKEFKKKHLDPISKCFCAAKWYDSTVWLYSGEMSGCHHNNPHKIALSAVVKNPAALHNTPEQARARKNMLRGERPEECKYCWALEDLPGDNLSDRADKSVAFALCDLEKETLIKRAEESVPRHFEIAFERKCNLACAYCSPQYSSTWENDLKNGPVPYRNFLNREDSVIYKTLFWKWWEKGLKKDVEDLRVTGGEPLLHDDFWKLLDDVVSQQLDICFTVNSNFSLPVKLVKKFTEKAKLAKNPVGICTSCESYGEHIEYVRDGLNFELFRNNVEIVCQDLGNQLSYLCFMMTFNALFLFSAIDFFDWVLELKEKYGRNIVMKPNVLSNPEFMNMAVLPESLREPYLLQIENWLIHNKNKLEVFEVEMLDTAVRYIRQTPFNPALQPQFKAFFLDFDRRRNKQFALTFPKDVVDWFQAI